jgi:prepilin-type N-terminal cleavage/methylation domain-containing protein
MNDRARAGGFTLVELLVVIAIIVVLAGLVFVLSAGVLEKARTTEKMNRYRNLYVANQMYASDNHGYICPASDGSKKWQELLSPYFGGARRGSDVFVDPLYERPDPRNVNLTGIGMGIYFRTPDSWQRNVVWGNDEALNGTKFLVVEIPEHRVLMGDSVKWFVTAKDADTSRHERGTKGMFLLCDGRAVLLSKEEAELGIKNPGQLRGYQAKN